ncbi:TetR/AcrR family transcriptional regulator [Phytoactinopolyspora limicola]|uniref:TetR/AcrR family transcriptional regulator n=1 Tax=Phytoactinopolyspora limicola TaxID=2715536 RepID=UPI00140864EE|nr:TetR/AcrR family transcriptional regulator [Phytoactinopolyspora limicola]
MARTVDVAAHERRRNEFLDAAQRLIESRGYERMSVQDVLHETGASRGAFYHYFQAKQELLSAVVDRFADGIAALLEPIAADSALSPMDQLRGVFAELSARGGRENDELRATLGVWYSDSNVLVRQRFRTAIIDRLARLLTPVVARGVREGVFTVPDPEQAGLILATMLQDLNDALADQLFVPGSTPIAPSAVEHIVAAHSWALERILGLPDGSTALINTSALLSVADVGRS